MPFLSLGKLGGLEGHSGMGSTDSRRGAPLPAVAMASSNLPQGAIDLKAGTLGYFQTIVQLTVSDWPNILYTQMIF